MRTIIQRGEWRLLFSILVGYFSIIGSEHISSSQTLSESFQYLSQSMDQCHQTFVVFGDINDASNHFSVRAMMPDGNAKVTMNECWKLDTHSGSTCIRCTYEPGYLGWGGFYFQNGVLLPGETEPRQNWGEYSDAGYDLKGTTQLSFWVKGEQGGEKVEFFIGGIGWNGYSQSAPYPESIYKHSTGYVTLSNKWQQYTISLDKSDLLPDEDLSYILGGFGWVTAGDKNNQQSIAFYLDDIQLNLPRLDEVRFLVSYKTENMSDIDFDTTMVNVAFSYDNALVLLDYLARGTEDDLRRAKILADTFVYVIKNDPTQNYPKKIFATGSPKFLIRNAYEGGDPMLPPGWEPNDVSGEVRMPGYWDCKDQIWKIFSDSLKTHTGNVAWVMIALINSYKVFKNDQYLSSAILLGEWVENNCRDEHEFGGYLGGFEGNPPNSTKLLWKSTEHNLDLYVAFMGLHFLLMPETKWENCSLHAKKFIDSMWDNVEGKFWTGTTGEITIDINGNEKETINTDKRKIPVDAQSWGVLVFRYNPPEFQRALEFAKENHYKEGGYDFNTDKDGIWFEGTAQMSCAYQAIDKNNEAENLITLIESYQLKGASFAANKDFLTTDFGWYYFKRKHIGATAWYLFAKLNKNPYWLYIPTTIQNWMFY